MTAADVKEKTHTEYIFDLPDGRTLSVDKVTAEWIQSLEKDAELLRWLRKNWMVVETEKESWARENWDGSDLDMCIRYAIDAAQSEAKP